MLLTRESKLMSVEINSYEELHICNVNGKTAAICGFVTNI
jgi:hypothetical protein